MLANMIGRLSGSVPATKESPLATSKAMAVSKNVVKMGKNILPESGMKLEWNEMNVGPQAILSQQMLKTTSKSLPGYSTPGENCVVDFTIMRG